MQQQLRTTFASVMLLIIFSIIISTAAIAEGDNTSSDRILSSKTSNSTNSSNHFSNVDYVANANAPVVIRRSKRYLDFLRLSRMFFRINMKENVLKSVTFWSRGYGYRANFNIENKRRIKRSMVYDTITDLINQHGFDGRACILKSMCEASKSLTPGSGIVFKLFKMIFSLPQGDEKLYPYLMSDDCDELYRHCPLSLQDVSPYTDD